MRRYSKDQTETYLRGFLGRMLFSNESVFKPVNVLSGGEKVRCMFSRMMLFGSNALILDQPTDHLDLESITAVNHGLDNFKGNVLFTSHDYEIVNTVANRIIELRDDGTYLDRQGNYEDFVAYNNRGIASDNRIVGKVLCNYRCFSHRKHFGNVGNGDIVAKGLINVRRYDFYIAGNY
jgi:ATPase subunit of ABC transporter with duplicated ATPase domains